MTAENAGARERGRVGRVGALVGYGGMLVGAVALYELIRGVGDGLAAPAPTGPPFGVGQAAGQAQALLHVLLALAVVIITARAIGTLFRYLHQPPVIGEIIAGILLGPSLLGRFAPGVSAYILPPAVAPFLGVLSQVGVVLYMFLVGLELDPALLRKRGQATVAISHASITLPFLLGAALALVLYPRMSSRDVPFTCFSLFVGVSMSVTAFPVLARILTDRRAHKTRMGVIALTCAAINDVTAWCLLALVVSVVQARMSGAAMTVLFAAGYIAAMVVVVRPIMVRMALFYGTRGRLTQGVMAAVFVALLVSALATDYIGIHAIFGAFALGAVIPHDSGLARELTDRLEDLVVVLLLPAFFAFTGMNTQIGLVQSARDWLLCGAIVVVASAGKFGGSAIAARLTGLGWRDSAALGILMNTRGLMELIVLDIGLELHVISPALFAMLVIMAVGTTFMTTPFLHLLERRWPAREEGEREAPAPVEAPRRGVLVPVSNPSDVAPLVHLALAATLPDEPPPCALALVRRPAGGVRSGLREIDQREPPRAPILSTVAALAHERGAHIDLQARWTDSPVDEILAAAASARWLLVGFHRPVFGADVMGGVVRAVLERAADEAFDVGVVIHGHDRPLDRVVAVVDGTGHGRATLDLAARISQARQCALHALLAPATGGEPGPELQEALRTAARRAGRWLHTDLLERPTQPQLVAQTRAALVVIGTDVADRIGLPLDDAGATCVIVVQAGARVVRESAASAESAAPPAA